jgi:hypothetical protein
MKTKDIIALAARYAAKYDHARRTLKDEFHTIVRERRRVETAVKAQQILQVIAQRVQETAHKQIAAIVTRCLKAVFDDPYTFKIHFERKRGKTEARMVFVRKGMELDPKTGVGGGVLDVAAFALRLACLLLQRPARRRLLILDEPFKFVSERKEYRERVRQLLESLSEEMDVQLVLVTHDSILETGKVVEI